MAVDTYRGLRSEILFGNLRPSHLDGQGANFLIHTEMQRKYWMLLTELLSLTRFETGGSTIDRPAADFNYFPFGHNLK